MNKEVERGKKPVAIISQCLLGIQCRYDGKVTKYNFINKLSKYFDLIPVCPEMMGGLKCPRLPSEIRMKEGCEGSKIEVPTNRIIDYSDLNFSVINTKNKDNTSAFISGSKLALEIALRNNATYAFLKEKSPSCGSKKVYDGTFNRKLIDGKGVLTSILPENIIVINEEEIPSFIKKLEAEDEN